MNLGEVKQCLEVLDLRERLIVKLAIIAGMRPGEIFGLTWGRLSDTHAEIVQRVYRGDIDTPKTYQSVRKAALSTGLAAEIEAWRRFAVDTRPEAWVFPSEPMTPLSKDNCWRRHIQPRLATVGLGWANFLVMRRTHSSIMKQLGVDPKLCRRRARAQPRRKPKRLHQSFSGAQERRCRGVRGGACDVNGAQTEHRVKRVFANC